MNPFNNNVNLANNYLISNNNNTVDHRNYGYSKSFGGNMNVLSPNTTKMNLRQLPIQIENKFSKLVKEDYIPDYKILLENIIINKDKRTTLMLRHIPNKYTLQNLVDEISPLFLGKFDYVNLPIDYERKLNLGYAFINFTDHLHIIMFYDVFYNKKWSKYKSDKVKLSLIKNRK